MRRDSIETMIPKVIALIAFDVIRNA
jgi:hypothetical protein